MTAAAKVETILLAEVRGEPAGFTSLRVIPYLDQDTPYAEVTQLYVRADFRRQGIANRLVKAAEDMALERGATCVHILTGKDNLEAQAFYRAAGYEVECLDFEKFLVKGAVRD
jgi:ribosomal protein S18 acetylase RimI-like enzyme